MKLALRGLELAPAQVAGPIRIVPLLRRKVQDDLRIAGVRYDHDYSCVRIDERTSYFAFIPQGLIISWTEDGNPVAAMRSGLDKPTPGKKRKPGVGLHHRMAKRLEDKRMRLLPLHLSMEGFMLQHFGGPEIAWKDYSEHALRFGLSPRVETVSYGRWILGLDDALRLFEIHDDQCGVLLFVAETLATAFAVPHPEDYRALHRSLLEDFYSELLSTYSFLYREVQDFGPRITGGVRDLDALARAVDGMREEWRGYHAMMAEDLLDAPIREERLHGMGPFSLHRFSTALSLHRSNHIGERVLRKDGTVEYLKTYRLSDRQVRRAHLLEALAKHDWELERTAASMVASVEELERRIVNAGFGYILKSATKRARR